MIVKLKKIVKSPFYQDVLKTSVSQLSEFSADKVELVRAILSCRFDYVRHEFFQKENIKDLVFAKVPKPPDLAAGWNDFFAKAYLSDGDGSSSKAGERFLLSKEDELYLFLQFNYARLQIIKIKKMFLGGKVKQEIANGKKTNTIRLYPSSQSEVKPMTVPAANSMIYWHQEANRLKDSITVCNLGLVFLALSKHKWPMNRADAQQDGAMAIMRAVDRFDVSQGLKFSTYATNSLIHAFSKEAIAQDKLRAVNGFSYDQTFGEYEDGGSKGSFADTLSSNARIAAIDTEKEDDERSELDVIKEIVFDEECNPADLTDDERQVIKLRFDLSPTPEENYDPERARITLKEAGKVLKLTQERVRQLQNKAILKIRIALDPRLQQEVELQEQEKEEVE